MTIIRASMPQEKRKKKTWEGKLGRMEIEGLTCMDLSELTKNLGEAGGSRRYRCQHSQGVRCKRPNPTQPGAVTVIPRFYAKGIYRSPKPLPSTRGNRQSVHLHLSASASVT